jgi:hypothetical protein
MSAVQGILELHPKGYGFLRNPARAILRNRRTRSSINA